MTRIASPIAAIGANHESVLSLPKLGGTARREGFVWQPEKRP